ncbi:hypothetical protein Ciccas_002538 [Cichlidogyrus casuarinus]|uniref:Methyltransferase type 11 domain-containing protein n=1 Tax=Cichlidogyrus casuarinus TaxID=1844966 RepID=A0ABD2QGY8_9PLAT
MQTVVFAFDHKTPARFCQCQGRKIDLLIDTACGSGQLTKPISKFCNKVIALDASESQIEEAKSLLGEEMKHVEYSVGNCEQLPAEDESVDVITVAEAIHYFADIKRFYQEVDRCLKPTGVLGVMAYNFCEFHGHDSVVDEKLNNCWLSYFRGEKYLEPCWHKGIFTLFDAYKELPLYRRKHVRYYDFLEVEYPLEQYASILRSLSAYITYYERYPNNPDMANSMVDE